MSAIMYKQFLFAVECVCLGLFAVNAQGKTLSSAPEKDAPSTFLTTYPAPEGAELNDDFTVKVRTVGGAWQTVPTYKWMVCNNSQIKSHTEVTSVASFDFSGSVEVAVTYLKGKVEQARVRPLSYGITPRVKGTTLTFTLSQPRNLSVEVNGDVYHNLHLFANPLLAEKPDNTNPQVLYFGPGVHQTPAGRWRIPSGTTVYVDGSAVLMAPLCVEDVRDVRILGRGMVHPSVKEGLRITRSRNIYVEGLTVTQCPVGQSDSVTVQGVKSISYYGWGDGMNVFASSNVLFNGVFCRNSDDCTTVYATRKGHVGSARNITMQNAVLWPDVAHPIFIGLHGNVERPDTIENLLYRNIDILGQQEHQVDYQGCLAINAGDYNLVRNVRFRDIRIEDILEGQLFNVRIFLNKKYCLAPGRGIQNVEFRDITYTGRRPSLSLIAGYDTTHMVTGLRFQNLQVNGVHITDTMSSKPKWYKTSDMVPMFVGEHVEEVVFE